MTKSKVAGLEEVKTVEEIQLPTLVGDVRDLLLQEMRDVKNGVPWTDRSEADQRDAIDRADRFSRELIRKVVAEVVSGGHPAIRVNIDSWTVKDGLKIVAKALAQPANIEAISNGTSTPTIVFASMEDVSGERAEVRPTPDQPMLGDDDDDGPVFDHTKAGKAA